MMTLPETTAAIFVFALLFALILIRAASVHAAETREYATAQARARVLEAGREQER